GFGAQRQRARGGAQRALAPAGADDPAGVGPCGVAHLGAVDGVAPVAGGAGVAALRAHVAGMLAELDEIAARAAGRDVGFGGQHDAPLRFVGAPALVRVASLVSGSKRCCGPTRSSPTSAPRAPNSRRSCTEASTLPAPNGTFATSSLTSCPTPRKRVTSGMMSHPMS